MTPSPQDPQSSRRLLLVLNEGGEGDHDDVHRALAELVAAGRLGAHRVYGFPSRLARGLSSHQICEEILCVAADLLPTLVLWSHTGRLAVSDRCVDGLRGLPSRPSIGFWDGDMYHALYKPLPAQARRLAARSDVVFMPGLNAAVKGLRRSGVRDIRYVPSATDHGRFGGALALRATVDRRFDVVMIGNRDGSRVPFKTMPGLRWRIELAGMLEAKLGRRFAVYGKGWSGPCAQGPIDIAEQGVAYGTGRLAVGNNNLHGAYYFSNRLPIAMSCGAVMVHNSELGLDRVLGRQCPVRLYSSTTEAWRIIAGLLEADDASLDRERVVVREEALARFSMARTQGYMVDVLARVHDDGSDGGRRVVNPWLGGVSLA